jgi:hypothetical protein
MVFFNNPNQQLRVFGIGGITGFFQSVGPFFVVGNFVIEQKRVAPALGKKFGMVAIGIGSVFIFPETFMFFVIIHVKPLACPVFVALDPKMVIGFFCQGTVATSRFQYPLCQRNRRRNFVLLHLFDGYIFVQINIVFRTHPLLCPEARSKEKQQQKEADAKIGKWPQLIFRFEQK